MAPWLPSAADAPGVLVGPRVELELGVVDSGIHRQVRLRRVVQDGLPDRLLLLDPISFDTRIALASDWKTSPAGWSALDSTPWMRTSRELAVSGPAGGGLRHLEPAGGGLVLTVDLCPSRKPMDRKVVREVWGAFRKEARPVPVAFSLSGDWIRSHTKDLQWLQSQVDSGRIAPTWVNHTDHHRFRKGLRADRNFLLLPGTDLKSEVLGAEREMLLHGIVPSAFFRFPGLIDNDTLHRSVLAMGLLPLGADAWLAKAQRPREGSIVLIHANGNEPLGVQEFLALLRRESPKIRAGQWHLQDLSDDLEAEDSASGPKPPE